MEVANYFGLWFIYGMKELVDLNQHMNGFEAATTEEIGRLLAFQGMILNGIGIGILNDAESCEGPKRLKRIAEATRTLIASKSTLVEASRILEKFEAPPEVARVERERLIAVAIDNGYEIAFEADGRVQLERVSHGGRFPVSV